jgi:cysteine synthase A
MKGAISRAEALAKETPNSWIPQQFENGANPDVHRRTTAVEIWEDTEGKVDFWSRPSARVARLPAAVRSSSPKRPSFQAIAVEPKDSPVISQTLAGQPSSPGLTRSKALVPDLFREPSLEG